MLFVLTLVVIGITNKTGIISDDIVLNRYVMQLLQQEKIYKYKTYRELEHGFVKLGHIVPKFVRIMGNNFSINT